jgi:hypothetical protein
VSVRSLWRLWALLMLAVVLAWPMLQQRAAHDSAPVAPTRQGARLPTLAPLPRPPDPAPTVARLAQSTLWGPLAPRAASGAAGGAEAPAPKWSLTGYYARSGIRHVVVSFDQPAMASLQLKVGDRLPDGSRIERIEPDRVRVRAPAADGATAAGSRWLAVTPGLVATPPQGTR